MTYIGGKPDWGTGIYQIEDIRRRRAENIWPPTPPRNEIVFGVQGTYNWIVPSGVFSVSVVCIGSGNGSGSLITSSGTSHFNSEVIGYGSNARTGGGFVGNGGGNGGTGGTGITGGGSSGLNDAFGGGGGAGGYSGNGGAGGGATATGSEDYGTTNGGGGGGTGIFGVGASGIGGTNPASSSPNGSAGSGGGGGGGAGGRTFTTSANGGCGTGGSGGTPASSTSSRSGGSYGGGVANAIDGRGGGGLGWKNNILVTPGQVITVKVGALVTSFNGQGAVRVVWPGNARQFPSTDVGLT